MSIDLEFVVGKEAIDSARREKKAHRLYAKIELLGFAARSASLFADKSCASNLYESGLDDVLDEIRAELRELVGV
jgi:hypothetical protein